MKDGFKGRGQLLAWDCILVVLKVMEVDLHSVEALKLMGQAREPLARPA